MLRGFLMAVSLRLLLGAMLFGSAGRIDWAMGWAFLVISLASGVAAFVVVDPELIQERANMAAGGNRRDAVLASAGYVLSLPVTLVVAGLDAGRFGWSPSFPAAVQVVAAAVFVLGLAFLIWAMLVNRFFSTFVRIQTERGHRVVSDGPYAYVRHPGYSGWIWSVMALPFWLGSLWAIIPALAGAFFIAARTLNEDRTLQEELSGYREYASAVRWRLLPGVW